MYQGLPGPFDTDGASLVIWGVVPTMEWALEEGPPCVKATRVVGVDLVQEGPELQVRDWSVR